jgi:hypothetical protein
MAVDKAMIPSDIQMMDDETPDMELDIEAITDEPIEITMDDGSIEVDFGTLLEADTDGAYDHSANLVNTLEDGELEELASDLVGAFIADRGSRKEWAMSYIKGLDLLGMKIEERSTPWQGGVWGVPPYDDRSCCTFSSPSHGRIDARCGSSAF